MFRWYDHHHAEKYITTLGLLNWIKTHIIGTLTTRPRRRSTENAVVKNNFNFLFRYETIFGKLIKLQIGNNICIMTIRLNIAVGRGR
jgi:hypothetical protein